MRALLGGAGVTHLPGVYDPLTAALAVRAWFAAVHLSGAAVSALRLGLPDLGYVHGTHIADVAAALTPAAAYRRAVHTACGALPYPVSASASSGTPPSAGVSAAATSAMWVPCT